MVVRELELDLDAFEGPFDLLLTLVLKDELEPAEVDVAEIVVAFVERLLARARPAPAAGGGRRGGDRRSLRRAARRARPARPGRVRRVPRPDRGAARAEGAPPVRRG